MSVIVDSSVWIDFYNPKTRSPTKSLLEQLILTDYPVYLCPVIYQEILQGLRDDMIYTDIKTILDTYPLSPVDIMDATVCAVDLYRRLRKNGITIRKSIDCLIAAYAITGNMYLLHNDSDFDLIAKGSGLKLFDIVAWNR